MNYNIKLTTKRLIIEPFTEKLLTAEYVSWLNDPNIVRFSEQRHKTHTLESVRQYLKSFENSANCFWAIFAKERMLGHIGNMTAYIDINNKIADLAILIGKEEAWGKGYATEAWMAVCRHLFEVVKVRKITAGCVSTNTRMLKLMERTGMIKDGCRRRHYIWENQEVDIVYAALFSDA